MKVKDLAKELERLDPELDVGFQPMGSISGSFVSVQSIGAGFDWQKGKAVLRLDKPVAFYEWYKTLDKGLKDLVRRLCQQEAQDMGLTARPLDVLEARLKKSPRKTDV